ncbi:hypothetical protein ZWY2020_043668 [Hordeum vulgare]|nr:hypothetical protein ZWY2020_043668 [Hordeum vulgare]
MSTSGAAATGMSSGAAASRVSASSPVVVFTSTSVVAHRCCYWCAAAFCLSPVVHGIADPIKRRQRRPGSRPTIIYFVRINPSFLG